MKIYETKQIRTFDAQALALGIPGVLLMEHAAMAILHHIEARFCKKQAIVILCGCGNNGGDGFALARLCFQKGYPVHLICNTRIEDMSVDEATYANIAKKLQIPLYEGESSTCAKAILKNAQIIVDALYGSGLSRDIVGYHQSLISLMNERDAYTIGVDIPSGLYADSGMVANLVVQCDTTISFGYGKLGLFINEGLRVAGHVEIVDIGIPKQVEEGLLEAIEILDDDNVRKCLPKRHRNSHKGSYGKALFIGGSAAMSGAITMAIQAALRCGVGTLTCAAIASVCKLVANENKECMFIYLEEEGGEISEKAQLDHLADYDVIAIGNGIGRGTGARVMVEHVLATNIPCILDADALYIAGKYQLLKNRKTPTILLPHPKEFYYLNDIEVSEMLKNPVQALKTWIKENPSTCIALKNTTTLIFDKNSQYLNVNGNDGLASGGSGDVLCGMVCAFLAQKASCMEALCCGVYLHARCAEHLVEQGFPTYSILPRDLIEVLPQVITNVIKTKKT